MVGPQGGSSAMQSPIGVLSAFIGGEISASPFPNGFVSHSVRSPPKMGSFRILLRRRHPVPGRPPEPTTNQPLTRHSNSTGYCSAGVIHLHSTPPGQALPPNAKLELSL